MNEVGLKLLKKLLLRISTQDLQLLISDLGIFGIDKTEGVCGGEARIARTRIPVWLLVRQQQLGMSNKDILIDYPTLREEDLWFAFSYYRANKNEINNLILENEAA